MKENQDDLLVVADGLTDQHAGNDSQARDQGSASQADSMDIVWASKLDDRYVIAVRRLAHYRAEMTISDNGNLLHRADVGLSYGALFGPDVSDVSEWQQIALAFVDGLKADPG